MNTRTIRRLLVATAIAVAGVAVGVTVTGATMPATTEPPPPPIAAEELTRVDEDTLARGSYADSVGGSIRFSLDGADEVVLDIDDLSHVAVARITVQPGAQFPWHTHPGPVLVNVVEGELVYVQAADCEHHSYSAGNGFVDPGRGNVHSAYNPTDGETALVAVFIEVTADGPLTITEGIEAPEDNCDIPAALVSH